MNTTVVACCQIAPALGNPAANRELAAQAISHAAAQGASVVVLPELVSSGYVFKSRAEAKASAEAADGATVTLWARLAADRRLVIIGGFCELAAGELFNSAALVDPGGLRCVYRKAHLWDNERLWFSPGSTAPPVIPTCFGQIAVLICYDLEFPEWARLPALDDAQLLCAPVNWPAGHLEQARLQRRTGCHGRHHDKAGHEASRPRVADHGIRQPEPESRYRLPTASMPPSGQACRPVTVSAAAVKAGSPVAACPRRHASTSLTWCGSRLRTAATASSLPRGPAG